MSGGGLPRFLEESRAANRKEFHAGLSRNPLRGYGTLRALFRGENAADAERYRLSIFLPS